MYGDFSPEDFKQIKEEEIILGHETDKKRAETAGNPKRGAFTVYGFFGVAQAPTKSKTPGKKDPPRRVTVILKDIEELTRKTPTDIKYRIDSPTQISVPHRNHRALTDLEKDLKKETNPDMIVEMKQLMEDTYNNIQGWTSLYNGKVITVSTFTKGNLDEIKPFQPISIINITGEYSEPYTNIQCERIFPNSTDLTTYDLLSQSFDLKQLPISYPEEEQFLVYFANYLRKPPCNGPVISQSYVNFKEEGCKLVQKDTPDTSKLSLSVWQKQEKAKFLILGDYYDQTKDKANSNKLSRQLGITDPNVFAKIMACNTISCIALCSVNHEKTTETETTDTRMHYTISVWINAIKFFLREYLLSCGIQVSIDWIRKKFEVDPETPLKSVRLELDDPDKPCMLNALNKNKSGQLVGDKVVLLNNFSGNLGALDAQGCEYRVLHDMNPFDLGTRLTEGSLDYTTKQGEAILANAKNVAIFAVIPYTNVVEPDEKKSKK